MSHISISEGPGDSLRFSGRQATAGEAQLGLRYPSPFFDIAQTYLPTSIKSMLRFCRYYFLTNPLINAVVWKMAEYPVTDLIYKTDDKALEEKYRHLCEVILNLKSFQIECNLDYGCYGSAFVSVQFPFIKYLVCKNCEHKEPIRKAKYRFYSLKFHMRCAECDHFDEAAVLDQPIQAVEDIRLIRWNPENVTIDYNPITGKSTYYYTLPATVKNDITMGKRFIIESVPHIFIEAVRLNKSVVFANDNIFHLKRPTIANKDMGWGTPLILPVLKDTFYMQILRKAQEAIMTEHIIPLRVLFPQAADATSSPFTEVDLTTWRDEVENEIELWRQDPNRIPVFPLPLGHQTIGGEGRALLLFQELRMWSEHIIAGMGVPLEFVMGSIQYSGGNVAMRMLENQFFVQRSRQRRMINNFILRRVAHFMGWPLVTTDFKGFRMADDLQRSAHLFQLAERGKVSDKTLLEDIDLDSVQEMKQIEREQGKLIKTQEQQAITQAAIQGKSQLETLRWQIKAQEMMPPEMMEQPGMGQPGMEQGAPPGMEGGGEPGMEGEAPPGANGRGEEFASQIPGMPEGATAYPENAIPGDVESPIGMQSQGDGVDLMYMAQRAVAALEQMEPQERKLTLERIRATSPQFFQLVMEILDSDQGSEPAAGLPLPDVKPPRRGPEAAM